MTVGRIVAARGTMEAALASKCCLDLAAVGVSAALFISIGA